MGPGREHIAWKPGRAAVDLRQAEWAGMWHSLAGLGREADQILDFSKCYPACVRDAFQPRCVGIALRVQGEGALKLEIVAPGGRILWVQHRTFAADTPLTDLVLDCAPNDLRQAKRLNWVAEPGARLEVASVGLILDFPPMTFAQRVFLTAYAKLARCMIPDEGLVKDRAQFPAGTFDAVPASGLFCLATSVAWRMGMVDRPFAERTLRRVHQAVTKLPHAFGLLPHFVSKANGVYRVHPGTEYSTVDTSLYFHGMFLAARMLGDADLEAELEKTVRAIQFADLKDADGYVVRGLKEDGRTRLGTSWREWGGETALVLLLDRMAEGDRASLKMDGSGKVYGGVGFIAEIQSLLYPQFGRDEPDAVSGVNWLRARRELLRDQMEYFPRALPNAPASQLGLFGLSAGEGPGGVGYVVNGTQTPRGMLIHPHYILMSALTRPRPADTYGLLQGLEARGLMPPWGLVENVRIDLAEYLPMVGSLNASFECLSAYHLWAAVSGEKDQVYEAAEGCRPTADAVKAFYPPRR
jgi:hypothetical protein